MDWEKFGKRKFSKNIVWGSFLIFVIIGIYSINKKDKELEEYGVYTTAEITYYHWGTGGVKNIKLQFKVNDIVYNGYAEVSYLPCAIGDRGDEGCIGTDVVIVYSSRDPNINKLVEK